MTSKREANLLVRCGAIAGFVGAALAIVATVSVAMHMPGISVIPGILSTLACTGFSYGLWMKSRICGVLLCALLVCAIVSRMLIARMGYSMGDLLILMFVVLGTYGAFRWHQIPPNGPVPGDELIK